MTPEARKLRDRLERLKADYTVLKRQRQKYQQEADKLYAIELAAGDEVDRKQSAVDSSYGLSKAQKLARKDSLKRAVEKQRKAHKEFSRAIFRRDKAEDQMSELADEFLETRMELEDLGHSEFRGQYIDRKVNPMAARKAKKKPSAKQLAARRKFAAAAKARSKAAKKAKPRKRNLTVIKAKRATIVQVKAKKANPARKRNVTSASDLVLVGEAKAATRDGVKGWMVARKFFPRSATPKTARLTSGAMIDLKYGDVWKMKRKGNPKYLVTGTKTSRKVEDLGILDDKSATAAIARARKLYKGHTNVKARRKNISQGFYDSNGIFHPIRAAEDYDAGTAGEAGGKAKRTRSKKRKTSMAKASRTARDRAAKRSASKAKQHLAGRALSRSYSLPAGSKRKKNIAQGFYDGNGIFHPIRASHDYDGGTAGETGGKPRRTRSKKRKESMRKASQTARQKAAAKQRKATTSRLATRSLQRSYPLKKARRNPNSEAKSLYQSFQGKPSKRDTSLNFPTGTPANLYKLGTLHSIKLQNGSVIKPTGKAVWLCADTKGKLHLGTTGERLVNAPKGSLGKVAEVEYITSKPHLGEPGISRYFHKLGEETGEKPTLYSDGNGGLIFKGGAYSITSRGIVN